MPNLDFDIVVLGVNETISVLFGLVSPKMFEELLTNVETGSITAELKVRPAGFDTGL